MFTALYFDVRISRGVQNYLGLPAHQINWTQKLLDCNFILLACLPYTNKAEINCQDTPAQHDFIEDGMLSSMHGLK